MTPIPAISQVFDSSCKETPALPQGDFLRVQDIPLPSRYHEIIQRYYSDSSRNADGTLPTSIEETVHQYPALPGSPAEIEKYFFCTRAHAKGLLPNDQIVSVETGEFKKDIQAFIQDAWVGKQKYDPKKLSPKEWVQIFSSKYLKFTLRINGRDEPVYINRAYTLPKDDSAIITDSFRNNLSGSLSIGSTATPDTFSFHLAPKAVYRPLDSAMSLHAKIMGIDASPKQIKFTPVEFGIGPHLGPIETRLFGNFSFMYGVVGGWGLGAGAGIETNLAAAPWLTLSLGMNLYYSSQSHVRFETQLATPEDPVTRNKRIVETNDSFEINPTARLTFDLPWNLNF